MPIIISGGYRQPIQPIPHAPPPSMVSASTLYPSPHAASPPSSSSSSSPPSPSQSPSPPPQSIAAPTPHPPITTPTTPIPMTTPTTPMPIPVPTSTPASPPPSYYYNESLLLSLLQANGASFWIVVLLKALVGLVCALFVWVITLCFRPSRSCSGSDDDSDDSDDENDYRQRRQRWTRGVPVVRRRSK